MLVTPEPFDRINAMRNYIKTASFRAMAKSLYLLISYLADHFHDSLRAITCQVRAQLILAPA